jgi:hypothetical protein
MTELHNLHLLRNIDVVDESHRNEKTRRIVVQMYYYYYYFLWLCSPVQAIASSFHEVS